MKNEIMMLKARIADVKGQIRSIDLEAKGLILVIRSHIDPFEVLSRMKTDEALSAMTRLHYLLTQRKELHAQLEEYEEALGK